MALALATLAVSATSEPRLRQLMGISTGLVVAMVVQIILGFAALSTSEPLVAWVHLLVATGIYGMAVAGTFIAVREDMTRASVQATR